MRVEPGIGPRQSKPSVSHRDTSQRRAVVENRGHGYTIEIVWHRRKTRPQLEKTNINPWYWEKPVYSTQIEWRGRVFEIAKEGRMIPT